MIRRNLVTGVLLIFATAASAQPMTKPDPGCPGKAPSSDRRA